MRDAVVASTTRPRDPRPLFKRIDDLGRQSRFGEMVWLTAGSHRAATVEHHPSFRRLHLEVFSGWLVQTPEQQWDDFCLYAENWPEAATSGGDRTVPLSGMIPEDAEHAEQRLWGADCGLLGLAARSACADPRLVRLIAAVKQKKGNVGLSLKELSREVRLSVRHVSRLCRDRVGVGFQQYVRTVRMVNALELLRHSADSVKEIASALGYRDSSNFCNEFRAEFALSPARYRAERVALVAPITLRVAAGSGRSA